MEFPWKLEWSSETGEYVRPEEGTLELVCYLDSRVRATVADFQTLINLTPPDVRYTDAWHTVMWSSIKNSLYTEVGWGRGRIPSSGPVNPGKMVLTLRDFPTTRYVEPSNEDEAWLRSSDAWSLVTQFLLKEMDQ